MEDEIDVFVGRDEERRQLDICMASRESEVVVVLGRLGVGKTALIERYFHDSFDFRFVGNRNSSKKELLQNFGKSLAKYSNSFFAPSPKDWYEAFTLLENYLETLPSDRKKVVFLDEIPWIDRPRSMFLDALDEFINGWMQERDDIVFIACGSATTWMREKFLGNRDGLHNRKTAVIHVSPFTLKETECYLSSRGFHWDRTMVTKCYMALGGVPYYLKMLREEDSLPQNIDRLFFSDNAPMLGEYSELYDASFPYSEKYKAIVKALSGSRIGLTRDEISKTTNIGGETLTAILENLVRSDLALNLSPLGKRNGQVYYLVDPFSRFYHSFLLDSSFRDPNFWEKSINTPRVNTWQGLSFETVCLCHLPQIKSALGLDVVLTQTGILRDRDHQIDLVIKRADRMVNFCEIKFSDYQYTITADYKEKIQERRSFIENSIKPRHTAVCTFITACGVARGLHSGVVDKELTLDDLFCK